VRAVFDTNVVLDVLLDREPHVAAAVRLFALVDSGRIDGLLCATTVTTVHDVASRGLGHSKARALIADLLELFAVAPVDGDVLRGAAALEFADFEDAVLHEAARRAGAEIVTSDRSGFVKATVAVYDPRELLAAIAASAD
jgi:predicted nucleic acid-binding protein